MTDKTSFDHDQPRWSSRTAPTLAIVSPCFNEEETLPSSLEIFRGLFSELIAEKVISEHSFLCLVDDGSSDSTWKIMEQAANEEPLRIKVVKLTRNHGHQSAILAGMETVREFCDCCVTIDADIQDDEWKIRDMVRMFQEEGTEIVLGVRKQRDIDPFFKRQSARIFYKLMHLLGCPLVENHADFRLMSRNALDHLVKYKESNIFLRGLVLQLGLKTDRVHYDLKPRRAGETKYTLLKMINLGLAGIISFSVLPIRALFAIGSFCLLLSACFACGSLFGWLTGNGIGAMGMLASSIWGIGGIQLLSLGVVGEYVGRVFLECKGRPRYDIEYQSLTGEGNVSVPFSSVKRNAG